VIFGGGYIANEFAGIFNEFSCEVTLVLRGDAVLRGYDQQIVDRLLQISLSKGLNFRFNAPLEKIEKQEDGSLSVHIGATAPIETDAPCRATTSLQGISGRVQTGRAWRTDVAGWR
jgi:glutathione reductase (NADPH)